MASELRRWLQKQPHPHTVRGWDSADEERSVKLGVHRSKWKDAEAALAGCAHLEALDADGNVLRVCDVEGVAPAPEKAKPSNTELVEMSKLLCAAYKDGANAHKEAYQTGFEALAKLVQTMSDRLAGLEKAWHRLIMSLPASGADPDDVNEGLIGKIVQLELARTMGGAGTPPNGTPHG